VLLQQECWLEIPILRGVKEALRVCFAERFCTPYLVGLAFNSQASTSRDNRHKTLGIKVASGDDSCLHFYGYMGQVAVPVYRSSSYTVTLPNLPSVDASSLPHVDPPLFRASSLARCRSSSSGVMVLSWRAWMPPSRAISSLSSV